MTPLVLFPAHPLSARRIDDAFAAEREAAEAAGFDTGIVAIDALPELRATIPEGDAPVLHRTWIHPPDRHAALEAALAARGRTLLTSTEAYLFAHHVPRWYPAFGRELTAETAWMPGTAFDLAEVAAFARASFGDKPVLVKDWVKSRKHEWEEACFIPSAASAADVSRVVARFLELQGDLLEGGLVFREILPFRKVGHHTKSGMPLVREFRCFFAAGLRVLTAPYWSAREGDADDGDPPPDAWLEDAAKRCRSTFFALDVAELEGGGWRVVEVNDGGTAGIPDGCDVRAFYAALRRAWGVGGG